MIIIHKIVSLLFESKKFDLQLEKYSLTKNDDIDFGMGWNG